MSMKKLQCRVVSGDNATERLMGLLVTVTAVDQTCSLPGFPVTVRIEEDISDPYLINLFHWKKGSEIKMFSSNLDPVDVEIIAETHRHKLVLRQAWAFCEARNDAWYRYEPTNKAAYRDKNDGQDWVDKRVYDVAQRSY